MEGGAHNKCEAQGPQGIQYTPDVKSKLIGLQRMKLEGLGLCSMSPEGERKVKTTDRGMQHELV